MMAILYYCQNDDDRTIENQFRVALPDEDIRRWPDTGDCSDIEFAITWGAPDDFYDKLHNLKAIFSLAAGVDHVLKHPGLPANIPLVRLLDAGMGIKMAEYVLYGVLHFHREMQQYRQQQKTKNWAHRADTVNANDFPIGVLGLGTLGQVVASRLAANGYAVHGWSRTEKEVQDIVSWHGAEGLDTMLPKIKVLVCLLPLTTNTRGIINQSLIDKLNSDSYLINVARGEHLVDEALLTALSSGKLAGAMLDVTHPEPLPENHAFWSHPNITITPHISAPTQETESVNQISSNLARFKTQRTYDWRR